MKIKISTKDAKPMMKIVVSLKFEKRKSISGINSRTGIKMENQVLLQMARMIRILAQTPTTIQLTRVVPI